MKHEDNITCACPKIGMKVKWNDYDCIVKIVKKRDRLVKVVADWEGANPMPYGHYWLDFEDISNYVIQD